MGIPSGARHHQQSICPIETDGFGWFNCLGLIDGFVFVFQIDHCRYPDFECQNWPLRYQIFSDDVIEVLSLVSLLIVRLSIVLP